MQSPSPDDSINRRIESLWEIKKCSICHCWTHAYNQYQHKYAVLLNNRSQRSTQGILSQENSSAGIPDSFGKANPLETLDRHFTLLKEFYMKSQALQRN